MANGVLDDGWNPQTVLQAKENERALISSEFSQDGLLERSELPSAHALQFVGYRTLLESMSCTFRRDARLCRPS